MTDLAERSLPVARPTNPMHLPSTSGGARHTGTPWRGWPTAAGVVVYATVATAAYWPAWPGDPARIAQCTCADAGLDTWFLAYTPFALLHGHNPFLTDWINAPVGMNLAINAHMPLLGLVAAPITLTAGALASYSLLLWLALVSSATSMFMVLRRWNRSGFAAFAGGLLYGFSPFIVVQSTAHLHLIFVALPPLILAAGVELLVTRRGRPVWWGVALGSLCAAQYLVSTEVLAMTALAALVGGLILAAAHPSELPATLRHAWVGMLGAAAVFVAVAGYPIALDLAGPLHGRPLPVADLQSTPFRADLLGPVVPTSAMRVTAGLGGVGDRLLAGDPSENGVYLGVPLLAVVAALVLRFRRDRWLRFAVVAAAGTFLLSLGPDLQVDGHRTGVPLPFDVLVHVPLVDQVLPVRLALFTAFFTAIALARGVDLLALTWRQGGVGGVSGPAAPGRRRDAPARNVWRGAVGLVVCAGVVVSLLPRWPNPTVPVAVPAYFTSPAVDRVRVGSTVLTYPYAMPGAAQPMVWQAVAGLRFKLVGGYGLVPAASGVATLFPTVLHPAQVQQFFVNEAGGIPFFASAPVADDEALVAAVRAFVREQRVGAVLVDRDAVHAQTVATLIGRAFGRAPVVAGGIDAWYLAVPPRRAR